MDRTGLTSRPPNGDGTCATSGGTTTSRAYDAADRAILAGYGYDRFGRTTSLPGGDSPTGAATTVGYYVNDLVRSITSGTSTRTFELDPARRLRAWVDSADGQTRTHHYAADGDTPSWTAENTAGTAWTRNVAAFTGLAATQTSAGTVKLQLVNLHGDIVATANTAATTYDPTTLETTEYGTPRGATARYTYLGAAQRQGDTSSGLTLMGARLYNPTTGRFLQVDPVQGGSANNYDYVGGDPVNSRDIDGKRCLKRWGSVCLLDVYSTAWLYHDDFVTSLNVAVCAIIFWVFGPCYEHRGWRDRATRVYFFDAVGRQVAVGLQYAKQSYYAVGLGIGWKFVGFMPTFLSVRFHSTLESWTLLTFLSAHVTVFLWFPVVPEFLLG